jgi:hypothetical protein
MMRPSTCLATFRSLNERTDECHLAGPVMLIFLFIYYYSFSFQLNFKDPLISFYIIITFLSVSCC